MKLDVRLKKIRSCIVLKDATAKNFVANEHDSFTFVFTFSVVVVNQPTDCILSFLFHTETDVLVPVFSQSRDVVVVNFVVVLKFPNDRHWTNDYMHIIYHISSNSSCPSINHLPRIIAPVQLKFLNNRLPPTPLTIFSYFFDQQNWSVMIQAMKIN